MTSKIQMTHAPLCWIRDTFEGNYDLLECVEVTDRHRTFRLDEEASGINPHLYFNNPSIEFPKLLLTILKARKEAR